MTAASLVPVSMWQPLVAIAMTAALAAGACAKPIAPLPELDTLITLTDPAMCEFTAETRQLIAGFFVQDPKSLQDPITSQDKGDWIRSGVVPEHLRDRFGPITRTIHDEWWIVRTEARGSLWGLPLRAIEQDFPVGGDPGALTFVFDAPIAEVERAVRARGMVARAGQAVPMGEPNGYDYAIILESASEDAHHSRLTCDYWS